MKGLPWKEIRTIIRQGKLLVARLEKRKTAMLHPEGTYDWRQNEKRFKKYNRELARELLRQAEKARKEQAKCASNTTSE